MPERWIFPEWMEPYLPWLFDESFQENRLSIGLVTRLMNYEDLVCDKGSISPTIRINARVDLLQRLHDKGYLVDPAQGVRVRIKDGWPEHNLASLFPREVDAEYLFYAIPMREAETEEGEGDE